MSWHDGQDIITDWTVKALLKNVGKNTGGTIMGKKESNVRPEGAVKPVYQGADTDMLPPPGTVRYVPEIPEIPPIPDKPVGMRDDGGKLKWHLLPVPALLALIKVFHGGSIKYADDQWRLGMMFSRIYRSMISHFMKWLASDSSYDKELGTHHLMMVAWGCFVLYMYEIMYKYTQYDDRPEKGMLTDADFEFVVDILTIKKSLTRDDMGALTEAWKAKHTL